jgi:hypothetical protein
MSEQQNQNEGYQSVPPNIQPAGYPPVTPPGMGYPPGATFPPPGVDGRPDPAFQQGQPFPPPPPPQGPFSTPRYRFYFSEDKMRRYFNPAPRQPILCILGGVFCLFISPIFLLLIFLPVFIGLTLMTVGLVWLIFKYVSRPSEEQYQAWLEERQRYLVDEAHRKAFLGNANADERFFFKGSVGPGTQAAKKYKEVYRKSSRLGLHYSINTYTIMFLTRDNIVVLSSEIDALNQMWATTEVRYYYYEHVSGVLFGDRVHEVNMPQPQAVRAHLRTQIFGLLIDNGEVMGSDTVVSMHIENASGATLATKDTDDLIQRMLSQLKVHKMSRLASLRENDTLSDRG